MPKSHCTGTSRNPALIDKCDRKKTSDSIDQLLRDNRLEQSRSQRILWLLEELQIPYHLKTFKRDSHRLAPAELKKIHPLGKSPIVTIERPGQAKPLVLAESGVIVEYLVEHFGGAEKGLVPQRYVDGNSGEETEAYLRYKFYMHYTEGSLMPPLVVSVVVNGSDPILIMGWAVRTFSTNLHTQVFERRQSLSSSSPSPE
jgi:glutathione S-transferase